MRILVLTLGTRGDFELFALLARTLAARGHSVCVGASHFQAEALRQAGLRHLAIGDGTQAELLAVMRAMGATADRVERTREFASRWLQPQLAQGQAALTREGAQADYFVSNLKLALARGGRVIPSAFVTYDPPLALEDLDRYGSSRHGNRILELVALPRPLADPSGEWGERYRFTGFWRDGASVSAPTAELRRFVEAGPPPVVLALGSMAAFDADALLERFGRALELVQQRGVVVSGWSTPSRVPAALCHVREADYGWLFGRASCVIHHGGVGTLAAVMCAGKPSILLPQIYSQALFGRWLEREHLSAGMFEAAALNPEGLATAIRTAVTDEALSGNALRWRELLRGERGVELAAELIEAHWVQAQADEEAVER